MRFMSKGLLAAALATFLPSSAWAMSCDEIVNMLDYNVPVSVVVDAMASSGAQYTQNDITCLTERGAPAQVLEKATSMLKEEAPPPAETGGGDEDGDAPPPSRFDSAESLGDDIDAIEDDDAIAASGDCGDLEAFIRDHKAKKFLTASYGLFGLIEDSACPTKDTTIKYWLGRSLYDLEMYHSAQHYFMEVVRKGPSNPLFKHALPRLAAIAAYTGNDYELLRIVGKIPVEDYPRQARPHLYYLMGRKSYDAEELSDAAAWFDQVPDNHELYPRAQYFQGIIHYEREKLKSAVKSFREVIRAEVPVDDPRLARELEDLKDLSIVNIGRIYFGLQRFDNAEKYYSQVDRSSAYWPQSLFERAWTNFYQGDLNETLGLLLTADSPYFGAQEFIPETTYLRALAYFSFCEYDEVERLSLIFKSKYTPMRNEMRTFIEQFRSDEGRRLMDQAYRSYFGETAGGSTLPASLFLRTLRNRDLASLVRHMDMMGEELEAINAQKGQWRDSIGAHLGKVVEKDRLRYEQRAGRTFLQELLDQYRVVDGLLKDVDVLQFEVADALRSDYMYKMQNPGVDSINEQPIDFATQTDIIYWPFNGEFWQDELAYYRYTEQGSCK
jgi:tetratricopeptide (TPR) repeat protein